jgi:hypothetical protein
MTQEAYHLIDRALSEQHARNEARRIRTRVHEARGNPHPAGFRWPFELLQNALDSGPRDGNAIEVRIRCEASRLIFEHTGAPFTSVELAALLSGGSSKEFESEETTGRFGTGFLVTHALADRTTLRGLLKVERGYERFELTLDRSGDEDDILRNTQSCNEAIRLAEPVSDYSDIPSASFEYPIGDDESSRYALCVVDLRNVTPEELDDVWTGDDVESLARVVPDIGDSVRETCELVESARMNSVAICNDSALRYEVPTSIWEAGISITEWAATLVAASRETRP